MKIILANGRSLRGDLLIRAVLRRDMAPIPVTLEADIASDESIEALLTSGQTIQCGEEHFHIIHSKHRAARYSQGVHERAAVRITGLLTECHQLAFVRERAVIKENTLLSTIYRACGARLKPLVGDRLIPRFSCFVGQVPTFALVRTLQECGVGIFWQEGYLHCVRLPDLFKTEPVLTLPDSASQHVASGFLEHHSLAQFFSVNAQGEFIISPQNKIRPWHFMPQTDVNTLRNLSTPLVQTKTLCVGLNMQLYAGQIIAFADGQHHIITTAAHYLATGTDTGTSTESYSKLWLATLSS